MKVLIVFNHPAPYKVRQFNELARYVNLTVIFERNKAKNRPDSFYNINKYNFEVYFFEKGYFANENSHTKELVKFLKFHYREYDKIVMNGYSTSTERYAINFLIRNHIPYILFINGGVIKKEGLIKFVLKRFYISHAQSYLSPSPEASKYLIHYGANPNTISLYPYSSFYKEEIVEKVEQEHIDLVRNRWHLPSGNIFVCPNQFIRRKNNMLLIKYFIGRKDSLVLVGNGPLKKKYEKYIKKNNMKNVFILDSLNRGDLFNLYQASTAIISLSKEDIFGHTILEGMANGIPAIASTSIVSAKSLILNSYNGFLVDFKSPFGIINALNNINQIDNKNCIETAKKNTLNLSAIAIKEALEK